MKFLEVKSVSKSFGGLRALDYVDFSVEEGELVGVIGPNGAGKSTLFNVMTGFHKATSGDVFFNGDKITNMSSDRIARLGMVRTFQQNVLLPDNSVTENLCLGLYLKEKVGFVDALLTIRRYREKIAN